MSSKEHLHALFGLDDKIAVVIGGTGQPGGSIASGLGKAGATIVVAGESEALGHRRVERIRGFGGDAGFMAVDVSSRESIVTLAERAMDFHGGVDVVAYCPHGDVFREQSASGIAAGKVASHPSDNSTAAHWESVRWVVEAFGSRMARNQGGVVIHVHPRDNADVAADLTRACRDVAEPWSRGNVAVCGLRIDGNTVDFNARSDDDHSADERRALTKERSLDRLIRTVLWLSSAGDHPRVVGNYLHLL